MSREQMIDRAIRNVCLWWLARGKLYVKFIPNGSFFREVRAEFRRLMEAA